MVRQKGELTLLELQSKVKREPDAYKEEFLMQLRHFESNLQVFELRPSEESKRFSELLTFISQTCPLYAKAAQHVPSLLMKLVEKHSTTLNPKVRKQIVMSLTLMRNRDFVRAETLLPFLFKLFKVNDKEMRKHIVSHIINDVKRLNAKSHNQKINGLLQGFVYKVLEEDDATAAQYSLVVLIDLYRRRLWTSDHTVNIISKAVFSKHSKITMVALKFFLGKYAKVSVEEAEKKEEEGSGGMTDMQVGTARRAAMFQFKKGAKKTGARRNAMKKGIKSIEKQRSKDDYFDTLFPAMEVLFDPQGFAEKLFGMLQKSHERFELRLLMMHVLAKCISCHDLIIMNFYPYLERYMEPYHRDVTQILMIAIESVHKMLPPEFCQPLMMTIANHFVNDKAEADTITVGLNTVREMCRRQPLLMTEDFLHDISEYKAFKKDKGVSMAAKSVIYLYRELQPTMLKKKDRGKFHDADNKIEAFGAPKPLEKIPGTELLHEYELEQKKKQEEERQKREAAGLEKKAQKDGKDGEGKEEDSDYEWNVSDKDDSDADSEESGQWVDVQHSDDDGDGGSVSGSDDEEIDEDEEGEEEEDDDEEEEVEEEVEDDDDEEGWQEVSSEDEDEAAAAKTAKMAKTAKTAKTAKAVKFAKTTKMEEDGDDESDDCPDLVVPGANGAAAQAMDEDEEDEEDEEEEDEEEGDSDDSDAPRLPKIDKKKLAEQKRQMLQAMQPDAAGAGMGDAGDAASKPEAAAAPPKEFDAYTRILTPRDFERIEQLKAEKKTKNVAPSTLKRRKKKEELMATLSERMLEFGTDKRNKIAREEKREQNLKFREKFKVKNKKLEKKGGGSTNKDKARKKHTLLVRNKESINRKRKLSSKQKRHEKKKRIGSMAKFKVKHG